LRQVKRRLEKANVHGAAERIDLFIDDVRTLSCKEVTCDDRVLTSEAYALLFYNARFLARHLRGQLD
jgi:hypothetical protein